MTEVREADIDTVKFQLKQDNIYIATVLRRCSHGYPAIVLLNPAPVNNAGLADDELKEIIYSSISNMLWLTCPYLNEKIHAIEDEGYIDRISDFIRNDRELEAGMGYAHAHYYHLRKRAYRVFSGGDDLFIEKDDRVFKSGIGGIRDTENLKCLHLHYAHFCICDSNIAGRITSNLLNSKTECEEVLCKHAAKER